MEIASQLAALAEKVITLKDQILTEEATKTAFVLPFINILGYDIFNPTEVVPEFTADIGLKKGEKVDYAIFEGQNPILIIECKHWNENLDPHGSQLFRYFHISKSRFALLTNGVDYRFYTDLEETNKMDERPFLEFSISNLKESTISEISKFHKSNFDEEKIVNTASSLKYTKEIKKAFDKQLNEPTDEFIRFFASTVYNGRLTEKVMLRFREITQKAINQYISEKVHDRLQNALVKESEQHDNEIVEHEEESKIVTTEEELDGYRIVVAIVRRKVDISRIIYRDTQSYFGILLDDNNRKPICRLHLNSGKKYISLFDVNKKESRKPIKTIDDIYQFEKELLNTVGFYD